MRKHGGHSECRVYFDGMFVEIDEINFFFVYNKTRQVTYTKYDSIVQEYITI